jgi:anti-sigma-K factor RskA
MTDPFIHDDAAYVLGALDPERRAAFERHLDACPDCRARVQQAASVLPALASVPVEAFDPVPETLLPGLMRRAAASRRRNRYLFSAVVGAAAACLAALVLVVWPRSTPQPASRPMAAVIATPVRASAALQAKPWGTEIELHCSYVGRVPATAYLLQVDDRAGHSQTLGTWRLVPGRETQYVSGTALRPEQISRVEIALPDGRAVLRLDL